MRSALEKALRLLWCGAFFALLGCATPGTKLNTETPAATVETVNPPPGTTQNATQDRKAPNNQSRVSPPPAPVRPASSTSAQAAPVSPLCYGAHMGEEPWLPRLAASTVLLVVADGKGGTQFATGGVVKGSGVRGGLANAIITADHAVSTAQRDGLIAVVSPTGAAIGWATQEAAGRQYTGFDGLFGASLTRGDIAVLRMRGFARGGADLFAKMEGIEIAQRQFTMFLSGVFTSPGGIDGGASGSPVLDETGKAIGIIVSRWNKNDTDMWGARVLVKGGVPVAMIRPGVGPKEREIRLPERSTGYIEPILDPAILARLGAPGQNIEIQTARDARPIQVVIPAMPQGVCIVYRGTVTPSRG